LGNGSTVYVRRFSDAFGMAAKTCSVFGDPKILADVQDDGVVESSEHAAEQIVAKAA